jgi:hypothetical protein
MQWVWTSLFLVSTFMGTVRAQQPQNLADVEKQLITYHDSGAYDRDLQAVASEAIEYLKGHSAAVKRPVLVLDIDETSLSNWAKMLANQLDTF